MLGVIFLAVSVITRSGVSMVSMVRPRMVGLKEHESILSKHNWGMMSNAGAPADPIITPRDILLSLTFVHVQYCSASYAKCRPKVSFFSFFGHTRLNLSFGKYADLAFRIYILNVVLKERREKKNHKQIKKTHTCVLFKHLLYAVLAGRGASPAKSNTERRMQIANV